jgi:hypothetical protein
MHSRREYRASLILAAALAGNALLSGGVTANSAHERGHWDAREDQVYRYYLQEQRLEYRDFITLSGERQQDYWSWRARHPANLN